MHADIRQTNRVQHSGSRFDYAARMISRARFPAYRFRNDTAPAGNIAEIFRLGAVAIGSACRENRILEFNFTDGDAHIGHSTITSFFSVARTLSPRESANSVARTLS